MSTVLLWPYFFIVEKKEHGSFKIAVICYIYKNLHICDYLRTGIMQPTRHTFAHNMMNLLNIQQQQNRNKRTFLFELNSKWLSIKLRLNRYEPYHFHSILFSFVSKLANRKSILVPPSGMEILQRKQIIQRKGINPVIQTNSIKISNGLLFCLLDVVTIFFIFSSFFCLKSKDMVLFSFVIVENTLQTTKKLE